MTSRMGERREGRGRRRGERRGGAVRSQGFRAALPRSRSGGGGGGTAEEKKRQTDAIAMASLIQSRRRASAARRLRSARTAHSAAHAHARLPSASSLFSPAVSFGSSARGRKERGEGGGFLWWGTKKERREGEFKSEKDGTGETHYKQLAL